MCDANANMSFVVALSAPDLTDRQRLVLAYIAWHEGREPPTVENVAAILWGEDNRRNRDQARRTLRALEEKGHAVMLPSRYDKPSPAPKSIEPGRHLSSIFAEEMDKLRPRPNAVDRRTRAYKEGVKADGQG